MTQFLSEQEAVWRISGLLAPVFHVVPEVWMRHLDGTKLRMDMAAVAKDDGSGFHRFTMIGVEVKRGYKSMRDFNYALKQAIDYRHSVIVDKRSNHFQNATPEFVFVYPDFTTSPAFSSENYRSAYDGSIRLAGLYNVGVIREMRGIWRNGKRQSELEFRVSDSAIWRSKSGICGPSIFGTARKRGAA